MLSLLMKNDFIEEFLNKVVLEKPDMIVVKDKSENSIGYLSVKRLSEILIK